MEMFLSPVWIISPFFPQNQDPPELFPQNEHPPELFKFPQNGNLPDLFNFPKNEFALNQKQCKYNVKTT